MFSIVLDGFVLLGLMYVIDRKNPGRDFLETGLVAFILTIANALMRAFLWKYLSWGALIFYVALCFMLLWKMTEIDKHKAGIITMVFVLFKIAEPYALNFLGISL